MLCTPRFNKNETGWTVMWFFSVHFTNYLRRAPNKYVLSIRFMLSSLSSTWFSSFHHYILHNRQLFTSFSHNPALPFSASSFKPPFILHFLYYCRSSMSSVEVFSHSSVLYSRLIHTVSFNCSFSIWRKRDSMNPIKHLQRKLGCRFQHPLSLEYQPILSQIRNY